MPLNLGLAESFFEKWRYDNASSAIKQTRLTK